MYKKKRRKKDAKKWNVANLTILKRGARIIIIIYDEIMAFQPEYVCRIRF